MTEATSSKEGALSVTVVPVTGFQQNCSILRCNRTGEAAVIDPGGDLDEVKRAADECDAKLTKILVTHAHLDHAGGVAQLAKERSLPIWGPHREDLFWIEGMPMQAQMFGMPKVETFTPDRWLEGGDVVNVGEVELQVRHCPGHTPGHVIFFCEAERLAFVGDVLFAGSIGRTDFPKGDHATLLRSIREQLFVLGDDVVFISGHGPTSTFGKERRTNPFLQ